MSDILYNEEKSYEELPGQTQPISATQILTGNVNAQLNLIGGDLRSDGYVAGSAGWKIDSNGNVEFEDGYFRGDITGASGTFTGTITATTGSIGGFDIGADYIRDVANSFGLASTVTGGDDVRFWAGDTFANRATADFRVTEAGAVTCSNLTVTGGSIAVATLNGIVAQGNLNVANQGWTQTCAFSAADLDTVAWSAGTLITAGGVTYNIVANNTGNMAARTYIFLDTAVSIVEYQVTAVAANAVGAGRVLVATAINGAVEPTWEVFGGVGGLNIPGTSIVAASITTSEIAANTIVAGNMNVGTLSAITADMGTLTAGTITTSAVIVGTNVITAESRFNALFTKGCFIGSKDDGAVEQGTVVRGLMRTTMLNGTPAALSTVVLSNSNGEIESYVDFTKDTEFVCVIELGTTTTTRNAFWGLTTNTFTAAIPDNATSVVRHIGFFIHDATLYASNGNNTTQTKTDVSAGITLSNENKYRIFFDSGTSCKFYINEVLVATHTTNLPATGSPLMFIGIDDNHELAVYNNYFIIATI